MSEYTNQPVNEGTCRKLFFCQMIMNLNKNIHYSKIGDFQVGDILFEIGGKNTTRQQIKNTKPKNWLVKSDILISNNSSIALMLFGFLY